MPETTFWRKKTWLCDSEIHAGQLLLKTKFPLVDSLQHPAIAGKLVAPQISELIQIINTGNHWVCLSTIGCRPGSIEVYDSLLHRIGQIAILHSCHMLWQFHFLHKWESSEANQYKWLWLVCTGICNRFMPWIKPCDGNIWPAKHASTLHQMPGFRRDGPSPKVITAGTLPCH